MANIGNFDPNAHEPSRGINELLPPAWYAMFIADSEVRETQAGGWLLWLEYECDPGHHPELAGRKVWHQLNLGHQTSEKAVEIAQRELTSICLACGIATVINDTEVLHGKVHGVRVRNRKMTKDEVEQGYEQQNECAAWGVIDDKLRDKLGKPVGPAKATATAAAPAAPTAATAPTSAPTTAAAPAAPGAGAPGGQGPWGGGAPPAGAGAK